MSKTTRIAAISAVSAFAVAAAVYVGVQSGDAPTQGVPAGVDTAQTTPVETGSGGRVLPPLNEAFLLTLTDIPVARPNGTEFTANVIAYCDLIDENYDSSKPDSLAAYTRECRAIIAGTLNYYGCDRPSFLASVGVADRALRARSLNRSVEETTDGTLLSEAQLRFIVRDRDYNVFTVTGVSNVDAALPYQGFTPGENCPAHFYSGPKR